MAKSKIQRIHEAIADNVSTLFEIRVTAERYHKAQEAGKDACARQFVAAVYTLESAEKAVDDLPLCESAMLPFACHARSVAGVAGVAGEPAASFHEAADDASSFVAAAVMHAILSYHLPDWPPAGEFTLPVGFPREEDCLSAINQATEAALSECPGFDELNGLSANLKQEYARTLNGEGSPKTASSRSTASPRYRPPPCPDCQSSSTKTQSTTPTMRKLKCKKCSHTWKLTR